MKVLFSTILLPYRVSQGLLFIVMMPFTSGLNISFGRVNNLSQWDVTVNNPCVVQYRAVPLENDAFLRHYSSSTYIYLRSYYLSTYLWLSLRLRNKLKLWCHCSKTFDGLRCPRVSYQWRKCGPENCAQPPNVMLRPFLRSWEGTPGGSHVHLNLVFVEVSEK